MNDLTPDGRIETASFVRLLKRALKTTIQQHPECKETLAPNLKLLATPKTVKEALASPQWREWRAAIDKELNSLREKQERDDDVYWYSFSNHYTKRAFTQP